MVLDIHRLDYRRIEPQPGADRANCRKTRTGTRAHELVVLPPAEYEALVERADREAVDAEDVPIYGARKAELAAGGFVLPPEVSAAVLRGDPQWREETQLHLSFKTGIAQGYLSDLETGRRSANRGLAQRQEAPAAAKLGSNSCAPAFGAELALPGRCAFVTPPLAAPARSGARAPASPIRRR